MIQYRVKALSVSGKNKKIFNSGDTVTAVDFPNGAVPDLVKNGFLEPLTIGATAEAETEHEVELNEVENTDASVGKTEETPQVEEPKVETTEVEQTENKTEAEVAPVGPAETATAKPAFKKVSVDQIKKALTDLGIAFNEGASKKELYDLWPA